MRTIDLKPRAKKFIQSLPPKHQRQVKNYILSWETQWPPHDARPLVGYAPYQRADVGEYRIIYRYDQAGEVITVVLVGRRNDGEVYRIARRILH